MPGEQTDHRRRRGGHPILRHRRGGIRLWSDRLKGREFFIVACSAECASHMNPHTFPGAFVPLAAAFLAALTSSHSALGQQPGVPPSISPEYAESSTEEGQIPLTESFETGREWRLETRRGALQDTEFKFNLRTAYFNREKFDGTKTEALAIGGWAGLKTGYFLDHISFGVTGYTSQPLIAPDDKDGTLLLKPGGQGYTVLGEAYADIRIIDDLNLYVGRKEFETPFINGDDTRMTPKTFEAIVLQGRIELEKESTVQTNDSKDASKAVVEEKSGGSFLKFGAGYFDRIKEWNSDRFISMSKDAGASVSRGVYTAGALYEKGNFSIGAIDYYSPDIINIGYAEATLKLPINADWQPKLSAQFIDERSVGDNLLQGYDFSGQQLGIKADLPVKNALFTAAYTYTTDGTNMQNPWSSYPGYTSVQVQDFNRAGERAFLIRAGYDFTQIKGLSTYALAVFGTDPSDFGQYRQNEYDFSVKWEPPEGALKGFSVRLRYALAQQDGGDVQDLKDFRVILNYGRSF